MPWYDGDCRGLADHAGSEEPVIRQMVQLARPWLEIRTGRDCTSFSKAIESGHTAVRAAAWVLYEQIMACVPAIAFDKTKPSNTSRQQFRTASEIMSDRTANCLELGLLFVGCALEAKLDPIFLSVDAGETDHAFVGVWLTDDGALRDRLCEPGGTIAGTSIPRLIGIDRFANADEYWHRISEANILVVDCSGAALGYPENGGRQGLNFEGAVARAWKRLTSTSTKVGCALDLRRALHKAPFPVWPHPNVIGREEDLEVVAAAASNNIVINGQLGVGKTVLARQYAFEHRHEYPNGVFLVNAAAKEQALKERFRRFAGESGIDPELHGSHSEEKRPDPLTLWVDKVREYGTRTLLIVDDVDDARFVAESIDGLPSLSSLGCRLLITTRDPCLLDENPDFESVSLATLSDEDATTLLLRELPQDRRDEQAGLRVCKQLNNLPLLIRVAGLTISGDESLSLLEYEQKLAQEGLLPVTGTQKPSDYPDPVTVVLNRTWQSLPELPVEPHDVLMLLSILPRNESIPFELLALMTDAGGNIPDDSRVSFVRAAAAALSATGLAEEPEEESVRIHAVIHEFAAGKAVEHEGFALRALRAAADRLHKPDFYQNSENKNLIRLGEQLKLLREPSRFNSALSQVLHLFDTQLDNLREGYDALVQLSIQARLDKAYQLAEILEQARFNQKGPWFRLRWCGIHERGHEPEAIGHSDAVSAVAIWPVSAQETGPTMAVSGAENGELIQWSLGAMDSKRHLPNIGAAISGLCISPDGSTVYASSRDGALRAIALSEGNAYEAKILGRHALPANDCTIDPEGRFVASVSDAGTVHVYSLPDGSLLRALPYSEHAPLLRCAMARQSGSRMPILITASSAGMVRVWNPRTGRELGEALNIFRRADRQPVSACALAPNAELAAVVTRHQVLLWNPLTGEQTKLSIPEQYVTDCCFSPDSRRLMLVGRSKRVTIYNIEELSPEYCLDQWYHWLTACAFGADGRLFFAGDDGSVHSWTYRHQPRGSNRDGLAQGRPNWVNIFRAGKDHVLSVSTDQTICNWHIESGKRDPMIEGHANWVNAFAISPDGKYVLSGTDSEDVIYWPLEDIDKKKRLQGFRQQANACAISADGATGLAASEDYSLCQWSLEGSFELKNHLTDGHRAAVTTCAVSMDGKHALSGGDDERVVLWDLEAGDIEKVFKGHEDRITAVVFTKDSPDIVISSSWDGTVKCWNARTDEFIQDFSEHSDGVTSCDSAVGGVVFSVSLDRTLRRWKLAEGSSDMRIHLGHRLRGLVVDPSGETVLCSDMAGAVYLFDVVGSPDIPSPSEGENCEFSSV